MSLQKDCKTWQVKSPDSCMKTDMKKPFVATWISQNSLVAWPSIPRAVKPSYGMLLTKGWWPLKNHQTQKSQHAAELMVKLRDWIRAAPPRLHPPSLQGKLTSPDTQPASEALINSILLLSQKFFSPPFTSLHPTLNSWATPACVHAPTGRGDFKEQIHT